MAFSRISILLKEGAANLHPAYFALVMATGIVSIAGNILSFEFLAWSLFYLNQFFYLTLWLFLLARLIWNFPRFQADLTDHKLGAGFFTVVAATNVLGSQFAIFTFEKPAALFLWVIGLVLWLILIYAFFTAIIVRPHKPSFESSINGAWLIVVVSTQSIAVLGSLIVPYFALWEKAFIFVILCFYLLGCMFYLLIMSQIFYRLFFFTLSPQDLTPPYWINMGAVAITTLAGANIIIKCSQPFIVESLPFIKGFTLFFWVTGTWWIPLLLILGAWRHLIKRLPFIYHPLYWGLVFPLGMYTVGTYQFAKALGLDFLLLIPRYFIYLALFAWLIIFLGMIQRFAKNLIQITTGGTNYE